MPDLKTMQRVLDAARRELRNLQMRPGQSAEKLEMLRKFECSCRAEIKLRRRAIEYQRSLGGG
jgi:hypothetical protein